MQVAQSKIAKQPGQAQTAKQIAEHTQRQASQAQDKIIYQTSQTTNQATKQTQQADLKL